MIVIFTIRAAGVDFRHTYDFMLIPNLNRISEELSACPGVFAHSPEFVTEFLIQRIYLQRNELLVYAGRFSEMVDFTAQGLGSN